MWIGLIRGLNDMFPGNGVQQGLRYVFSCLVGVSEMSEPISSDVYVNHAVLKRQLAQCVQVKSFNVSAAARHTQQLKILEDMFVMRVL